MQNGQARTDLGRLLVEAALLDEAQLSRAKEVQAQSGLNMEAVLLRERWITPEQLAFIKGLLFQIPFLNLRLEGVPAEIATLLPESVARARRVIPAAMTADVLTLAMEDPADIAIIDNVSAITRKMVEPVIATPQDILEIIEMTYRVGVEIKEHLSHIPSRFQKDNADVRVSAETIADAPVVRAIDLLIKQAVTDRASDIHIEPQADRLRVRFRIDGILSDVMSLPMSVHPPLLSRVKIMAGLNIAERRRPQDGQITFDMGDKEVDLRVATSNSVHGEIAVLRILDKSFALMSLSQIGFLPEALEKYQQMVKTPFGMILISGPTGSGKTTTQYATVNKLDSKGRNILTIEDPVEYRFDNINQMQVNPAAGFTFASGLRAAMRLDPDVILVGEIRDAETAQIGVQASLTGHLVLSSVHANDTVATILRMMDLGTEAFLLVSALVGITAQRMVRRVCPYCARQATVNPDEQEAYEKEMNEKRSLFMVGDGCNYCANTGYLGRTGIFEVLTMNENIRRLVLNGAGSDEIRAQAVRDGTVLLWRDGMIKVKAGITTPAEVIRNVYSIG